MAEGQANTRSQSQGSRLVVTNVTDLVAGKTGAVNTAVLLWSGAPAEDIGGDNVVDTNDADDGTTIVISQPGIYVAELDVLIVGDAAANPTLGISKNVAVGGLTAVPAYATAGMLKVLPTTQPAATDVPQSVSAVFEVTDQEARAVAGGITGAIIRFHAAIAGPAAPGAGLAATPARYSVRALGPAFAGG